MELLHFFLALGNYDDIYISGFFVFKYNKKKLVSENLSHFQTWNVQNVQDLIWTPGKPKILHK